MGEWIKIDDAIPEEGEKVLVYLRIYNGRTLYDFDVYKNGKFVKNYDGSVIYWTRIEPPKEDD